MSFAPTRGSVVLKKFRSDDLIYQCQIAEGGMGEVSLYKLRSPKEGYPSKMAVKTLLKKTISVSDLRRLRSEMAIHNGLRHKNIIRTYGVVETGQGIGLVLQYLPHGSYTHFFGNLLDFVDARSINFHEVACPLKIRLLDEIIDGMEYLHGKKPKKILHLDLKAENILLGDKLQATICDFGLSRVSTLTSLRASQTITTGSHISGTPAFIAPERLLYAGSRPTTKCDVYSFGILTYTILTDLQPYPDFDMKNYMLLEHHIATKSKRPDVENVSDEFPSNLIDMMQVCWSSNPKNRPSFQTLKEEMTAIKDHMTDFDTKANKSTEKILRIHGQMTRSSVFDTISGNGMSSIHDRSYMLDVDWSSRSGFRNLTPLSNDSTGSSGHSDRHSIPIKGPVAPRDGHQRPSSSRDERDEPGSSTYLIDVEHVRRIGRERRFCSWTRMVSMVLGGLIFSAAIAICLAVFVFPNAKQDSQCSPLRPPDHGKIFCKNATREVNKECQFTCNEGFELVGAITTTCLAGKWTKKPPSCWRKCKDLKKVLNGNFICTNHSFEKSICRFNCENSHVLQGSAKTTCLMNGNWSNPEPTCICPKCSVGNTCQYPISWLKVEHCLDSIKPYQALKVHYGGKVIACIVVHYSISTWSGSCSTSSPDANVTCTDYKQSSLSAKHAAAELITQLARNNESYPPCDPSLLPTGC